MIYPFFVGLLTVALGLTPVVAQTSLSHESRDFAKIQEISEGPFTARKFPGDYNKQLLLDGAEFYRKNEDVSELSFSGWTADLAARSTPFLTSWLIYKARTPVGIARIELLDCTDGIGQRGCRDDYDEVSSAMAPFIDHKLIARIVGHHLKIGYTYSNTGLEMGKLDLQLTIHEMFEGYYAHLINEPILSLGQSADKNTKLETYFNRISAWNRQGDRYTLFESCYALRNVSLNMENPFPGLGRTPCQADPKYLSYSLSHMDAFRLPPVWVGYTVVVAGVGICLLLPRFPTLANRVGAYGDRASQLVNQCYALYSQLAAPIAQFIQNWREQVANANENETD